MYKVCLLAILSFAILCSCSPTPVPIEFGKDDCDFCKMKIMDKRFGAEIVTNKGKAYKFDDINCMVAFLNEDINPADAALLLVIDYGKPETLIDATEACFVHDENIRTPMAAGVVAYGSADACQSYVHSNGGITLPWTDVAKMFE